MKANSKEAFKVNITSKALVSTVIALALVISGLSLLGMNVSDDAEASGIICVVSGHVYDDEGNGINGATVVTRTFDASDNPHWHNTTTQDDAQGDPGLYQVTYSQIPTPEYAPGKTIDVWVTTDTRQGHNSSVMPPTNVSQLNIDVTMDWYFKPASAGAPSGMPDFDQKQYMDPAMDGPTAVADCFWWYDASNNAYDDLVTTSDPTTLITDLHTTLGNNPVAGIDPDTMQAGINDWLNSTGTDQLLYEHTEWQPNFTFMEEELERCQDVMLLFGFWYYNDTTMEWQRVGGHWVTMAGVNSVTETIAVSDPYFDWNGTDMGPGRTLPEGHDCSAHGATNHNNPANVSQDYYDVNLTSPSPGGELWLPDYPAAADPVYFEGMNVPSNFTAQSAPWDGTSPIHTEIEAAVMVSPLEVCSINLEKTVRCAGPWVEYVEEDIGNTVTFNITVENDGVNTETDYVHITDVLPTGLSYVGGSATVTPTSVSGQTIEWNITTPMQQNEVRYIEFEATVDDTGFNMTNEADVEARCIKTTGTEIVTDMDNATVFGLPIPGMDVYKDVWDGSSWSDFAYVRNGTDAQFRLSIHNNGQGTYNLTDISIVDFLPDGLAFNGSTPSPDAIETVTGGQNLKWWFYNTTGPSAQTIMSTGFEPVCTWQTASRGGWVISGGEAVCEESPSGTEDNEWLISPVIDLTGQTGTTLKFYSDFYNSSYSGDSYGDVWGSTDGGSTWTQLIAHYGDHSGIQEYDISSWADGESNVKIAFQFYSTNTTSDYDDWTIDDFWVGTLGSPTNIASEDFAGGVPGTWTVNDVDGNGNTWAADAGMLNVSSINTDEEDELITQSYDCSAYGVVTLEFFTLCDGFNDAEVEISTNGGSTWTEIDDLSSSDSGSVMSYDISSYAAGESDVQIMFRFYNSYQSPPEYWAIDNFYLNGTAATTIYEYDFSTFPPAGWNQEVVVGTDYWNDNDGSSTHPSGVMPYAGSSMAEYDCYSISSGNSARLYTTVDLSGYNNCGLSFWMNHDDGYSYNTDNVTVQVSTDGGTTWTDLATFMRYDPADPGWVNHNVGLSAYDGMNIMLGFLGTSDYGNSIYIDAAKVTGYNSTLPTLNYPAGLPNGEWLNITFDATAVGGNVNVTNELDVEATATITGTTLSGSDDATVQEFIDMNPPNTTKTFVGPHFEKTGGGGGGGPIYSEDFSGGVPPTGWSQEEAGEWESHAGNDAGGTAPEAQLSWLDINGDYAYLDSEPVDTSSLSELYLQFKSYVDDYAGGYDCNVYTRADSGDSWTDVTPWTNPINDDVGPDTYTIDISHDIGTGTQVRFEFDGYYFDINDWNLDDFKLAEEFVEPPAIFFEDFEDGYAGWTIYNMVGPGSTWEWRDTVPYGVDQDGADGYWMAIADDEDDVTPNIASLVSPTFDCSAYENVMLNLAGSMQAFAGDGELWMNISTDGGSTWSNVYTVTDDENGPWTLDISSYADMESDVMLNFTFSDEDYDNSWGALVDNVKVTGDNVFPTAGDYVTTDTDIWLNATDDISGVDYLHVEVWWDQNLNYQQDPGEVTTMDIYDGSAEDENPATGEVSYRLEFTGECYHEVTYYAVDVIGNQEDPQSEIDFVDDTPPTTTHSFDGPHWNDGANDWVTCNTDIVLEPSDGPEICGVDNSTTFYRYWNQFTGWTDWQSAGGGGGGPYSEDFEADDGGYTHFIGPGSGTADDWEWGTPTSGPGSAHSGSNCWATNLDGDFSNNANAILASVPITIPSGSPQLTFWHVHEGFYDWDCGNLKISTDGGSTWSVITPVGGYPQTAASSNAGIAGEPAFDDTSGWEQVTVDMSAYAGQTVQIGWHWGSSSVVTYPGWYIDDVEVTSAALDGERQASFSLPDDGIYYVEYYSNDALGNNESAPGYDNVHNITVIADCTPPAIDKEIGQPQHYDSDEDKMYVNSSTPFTITAYEQSPPGPQIEFYLEDFEAGMGGWTAVDGDGSGYTWEYTDVIPSGCDAGGASGYFMGIDDDDAGSGSDNYDDQLISPTIDCTGRENVMLDFDGDFEDYADDGQFWVNVSADGGSTWTNVLYQTEDLDPGGYGTGFDEDPRLPLDISAYADNNPNFVVKFTYADTDPGSGSGWAWGALVDNVKLIEQPAIQGVTSGFDNASYRVWYNGQWSDWTYFGSGTVIQPFDRQCMHYLEIRATDMVGNEYIRNQTYYVDNAGPLMNVTVDDPFCYGTHVTSDTKITVEASDSGNFSESSEMRDLFYSYPTPNDHIIDDLNAVDHVTDSDDTGIWVSEDMKTPPADEPFRGRGVLYEQVPHTPSGSWTAATTDTGAGYKMYDNFWGVSGTTQSVTWYGLTLYFTGSGWIGGDPDGMNFYVDFYSDPASDTSPSDLVQSFDFAPGDITATDTGLSYAGYTLYKFEASLPTGVYLPEGWISVQSHDDPQGDWLLWMSSPDGDGYAYHGGSGAVTYDLGYTLYGGAGGQPDPIPGCDSGVQNLEYRIWYQGSWSNWVSYPGYPALLGEEDRSLPAGSDLIDELNTIGSSLPTVEDETAIEVDAKAEPTTGEPTRAGNVLFEQVPHTPSQGWSMGNSDYNMGYKMYENFWDVTGSTRSVTWYGLTLYYSGGWYPGDPAGMNFYVDFYSDPASDTSPSDLVQSFDFAPGDITVTDTGLDYSGFSMYKFDATLPSSVTLDEGWIAVQSHDDADGDAFMWASSPNGDGYSYQGGSGPTYYDRAITLYGAPPGITLDGECTHYVEIKATDNLGQTRTINHTYKVDNSPPQTTTSPDITSKNPAPGTPITISAVDQGACPVGGYTIYYQWKDQPVQHGDVNSSVTLTAPTPGTWTITYWAVDCLGNEEQHHTVEFRVMPDEQITDLLAFDGPAEQVDDHWEITPDTKVMFDMQAAAPLGIAEVWYRIDNGTGITGEFTKYTGPFTMPTGTHSLYYYGVDNVGRFTPTARTIFVVSAVNQAPTTTCSLNPESPNGDNGWYTSDVTVTLTAADPEGDAITTYYKVDDGDWTEYTGPFTITEHEEHTIYYRSTDSRDNQESTGTTTLKIDQDAPEITVHKPAAGNLYLFNRAVMPLPGKSTVIVGKIDIEVSVSDPATSGIAGATLSFNGEVKKTFTDHTSWTLDEFVIGAKTITVEATDGAGNKATENIEVWLLNL